MNKLNRSPIATGLSNWATNLKSSLHLQIGWGLSCLWLLAGLLLLSCRMLGSFTPDTDSVRALGVVLLLNGIVLSADWLLLKLSENSPCSIWEILVWPGFFFAGAIAMTLAMLPGGSSLAVLSGIGILLLLGFFLAEISLGLLSSDVDAQVSSARSNSVDMIHGFSNSADHAEPEEQLTQWLSRKQDEQGTDIVEGMVRLELAAGQIQKAAHVAFTPSFSSVPQMECEPLGDAEVEVIVGDVYPHGFRVEIRRTDSNREATEVEVGFQAVCANSNQNAA